MMNPRPMCVERCEDWRPEHYLFEILRQLEALNLNLARALQREQPAGVHALDSPSASTPVPPAACTQPDGYSEEETTG